jgi:transcriptional regulator with XRE-family HTH domain
MSERFDRELFSSDFKEYRVNNKLSQQKFAQQLGLKSHTLVSKIESNNNYPSDDLFNKFCALSSIDENKYWKEKSDEKPFAFLKGQSYGVSSSDIEKLCKNIATQEYLMVLKKRYYEK